MAGTRKLRHGVYELVLHELRGRHVAVETRYKRVQFLLDRDGHSMRIYIYEVQLPESIDPEFVFEIRLN
jgi:hypothetical protein